eukprot:1158299-Pelagomonas_calceolata.AAC.2
MHTYTHTHRAASMSAHPTGRSAADEALLALASSGQVPQEYLGGSGVAPNTEASEHVLQTWRTADCVCFDVGCELSGSELWHSEDCVYFDVLQK